MQAKRCASGLSGCSVGTASLQAGIAMGQRVLKAQPAGGAIGEGSSPRRMMRRLDRVSRADGSATGVADSSARVYGCCGSPNTAARIGGERALGQRDLFEGARHALASAARRSGTPPRNG